MTRIAAHNVRSIKNKDQLIVNELNDDNVDTAVINETNEDQTWLDQSEFKQCNYSTLAKKTDKATRKEEG